MKEQKRKFNQFHPEIEDGKDPRRWPLQQLILAIDKPFLSILRGVRFLLTQWDAYVNSILQCVVQGNQPGLGQHIGGSHSRACGPTRQDRQGPRVGGNMDGQLFKMHWISLTTLGEAVHQLIKNDNIIIVSKCVIKIFSGGCLNTNMMHMHGSSIERRKYPDIS